MIFLKEIKLSDKPDTQAYPFGTPLMRHFESLEITTDVTFFVGENGSGKSTLIEGIAAAADSVAVGARSVAQDETLVAARQLARHLRLSWQKKTKKGFFLRAEDFFNFARKAKTDQEDLQELANHYDKTLTGYGRQLAMGSALGQKSALRQKYGENLDANSHGESFLRLFQSRLQPDGLYLLDEPEVPPVAVPYDELEHVKITRSFLTNPESFLKHL